MLPPQTTPYLMEFKCSKMVRSASGLQLILMYQNINVDLAIQSPTKSRDRNSCSTAVSQDHLQIQDRFTSLEFESENLNLSVMACFQPEVNQPEISARLHRKAINVLFNICWDRNIDGDALWTSLMVFYTYKAKKFIRKIQLEKIVTVCILIGCKLFSPQKLILKDILEITNGKHSPRSISQTEAQIINTLNFETYIANFPSIVVSSNKLSQNEKMEFNCLSQIMMIENSDIFWKKTISSHLMKLIRECPFEDQRKFRNDLVDLSKSKQGDIVLRKYSSKLDTQLLIQKVKRN